MKTIVINGQNHHGSTYHIGKELADKIGGGTSEFFLPKDFGEFCLGCTNCFIKGEETCPHHEKLKPIIDAIDEADVVILTSPVYVMHASGSMKAFLDHLGYRWMVHSPEPTMFMKQGVCISTAAGAGMSVETAGSRQPAGLRRGRRTADWAQEEANEQTADADHE